VRVKTSVTPIPERAAVADFERMAREARDRVDIEIIERNAESLSREAANTLEYQQLP